MIKVKASVKIRKQPEPVLLDIPNEYCNRKGFTKYINEQMMNLLKDYVKIDFEVVED